MPIQLVLFGPGTVHALDDAEHHHRKAMFLEVLTPDAVAALGRRAEQEWESAAARDVLGVALPRGGLVVLDVHGTDHDPAHWPDPDRFDPDRFLQDPVDLDTLVPQGGGDLATGHRCPGEAVTLMMLAVAARVLARTPHTLPAQDLAHDLSRIPTRPRSGVVLEPRAAGVG
jgi:cytochrome P450